MVSKPSCSDEKLLPKKKKQKLNAEEENPADLISKEFYQRKKKRVQLLVLFLSVLRMNREGHFK